MQDSESDVEPDTDEEVPLIGAQDDNITIHKHGDQQGKSE